MGRWLSRALLGGLWVVILGLPAAGRAATTEGTNHRTYGVSHDWAWNAVTRIAYGMPGWFVLSASEESGFVTVKKSHEGMSLPRPNVMIHVEPAGPEKTMVTLKRVISGPLDVLSWGADRGEFTQFFRELDALLSPTPQATPAVTPDS